jgi:hypothetical protein
MKAMRVAIEESRFAAWRDSFRVRYFGRRERSNRDDGDDE